MHTIAVAALFSAFLITGVVGYLNRYAVLEGSSGISYRLHDRWTNRLTTCTRIEAGRTEPAEVQCAAWTPIAGGRS